MPAVLAALLLTAAAFDPAMPLTPAQRTEAVDIIEAMKTNRRGPYQGVSWFCNDGTVLPPKMYACVPHGGGVQYGVLSPGAEKLATMGLHVGTILTAVNQGDLVLAGTLDASSAWKISLTYLVPYFVSICTGVSAIIAHDRADALLGLFGVEITHPLTQSAGIKPRRCQHTSARKEAVIGQPLRRWTFHH